MGGLIFCIRTHVHDVQRFSVRFRPPCLSSRVSQSLPVVDDRLEGDTKIRTYERAVGYEAFHYFHENTMNFIIIQPGAPGGISGEPRAH